MDGIEVIAATGAEDSRVSLQPISYVLFDASTGTLLGGFLQTPPEGHENRIEVPEDVRVAWPAYRLNAARDGVEPAPAASETPVPVPPSVTRRQARQALLLAGLLDTVPAAIARLDDGTPVGAQAVRMAQIEWEDSLEFERARPLVVEIATAIGLDAAALDQLFITAARM